MFQLWLLSTVFAPVVWNHIRVGCLLRSRKEFPRVELYARKECRDGILDFQFDFDQGFKYVVEIHPGGCLEVLSVYRVFPTRRC